MKRSRIHIDADIRRASTLPSEVYRDPAWYEAQRERIFGRTWHWLSDASGIDSRGRVRPLTLLPGTLDEPVLLACDEERRLRCMSNVCTHRGALVVDCEGELEGLRCRYHGRRFHLDGRFASMPGFEGAEGFPSPADDLPAMPMGRFRQFLFAAVAPAFSFDEWIGPVRERTDFLANETLALDPTTTRDYWIDANWALYCDNYLEGFHIPFVHRGLVDKLDWGAYRTETFSRGSVQIGVAASGEPAFDLPSSHPDHGQRIAGYYFWLFPGTMLNFYPWGISINLVEPHGPSRTRVRFLSYVSRPELREKGAGAGLHQVEMEDEEVVTSVARGIRSLRYDRGRYSPTLEIGVHHFHRLLADFLSFPLPDPHQE